MKDFNLAFAVVKTGRSLAASYNLQNDIQRKRPHGPPPPLYHSLSHGLQYSFRLNQIKRPNYSNHRRPLSSH